MTKQRCQLPRFAWHLTAFDENFPFHKGSEYYKAFRDGVIYYGFETDDYPENIMRMAKERIARLNLNLIPSVVKKKLDGRWYYHLIIQVKGYYYEGA